MIYASDVEGSPTTQTVRGAPAKGIASGSSRIRPALQAAGHADALTVLKPRRLVT
jgi:hypothetical protein